ncbi:unnamed protein product [Laminaria digitata]
MQWESMSCPMFVTLAIETFECCITYPDSISKYFADFVPKTCMQLLRPSKLRRRLNRTRHGNNGVKRPVRTILLHMGTFIMHQVTVQWACLFVGDQLGSTFLASRRPHGRRAPRTQLL